MSFKVVIPARYASTRLPGKPLLDLAGKPMLLHVVEKAIKSSASEVVVATDDERILKVVHAAGFEAIMTSTNHESGTDRIAEVVKLKQWSDNDIVVNIQGDEPLIDVSVVEAVAERLQIDAESEVSTACFELTEMADFINPNNVKVVLSQDKRAIYFSRAPIPYPRDTGLELEDIVLNDVHQHIGIYGYRVSFLKLYSQLNPSRIEQIEKLEQLRILDHGYKISIFKSNGKPEPGIDTQEDLERIRQILARA